MFICRPIYADAAEYFFKMYNFLIFKLKFSNKIVSFLLQKSVYAMCMKNEEILFAGVIKNIICYMLILWKIYYMLML